MISKREELCSSQTVPKLKQVAIDKKQMSVVLNQLVETTQLNKVLKLVFKRLSKVIPDILCRYFHVNQI